MLLQQGHGKAVDWWCLGILTCEMLQGRHPFDGGSHYQTLRNMVLKDPVLHPTLSAAARSLVKVGAVPLLVVVIRRSLV